MTATKTKMRSPIKRHGAKHYLARRLIALFPEHQTYVEPFCGGCSVLLNKPRSEIEVASDRDADLISFWWAIQSRSAFPDVLEALRGAAYCRDTFDRAGESARDCEVMHAVRYLIRNRMSRGGMGKTFAWSDRPRRGKPEYISAWETALDLLPAVHRRVEGVTFTDRPASLVIEQMDSEETLFYLDPPYLHETRTATSAYSYEMSAADHASLLDQVLAVQGQVILSGYPSPLYDLRLASWRRLEWDMPNHSGQTKVKSRRTEVVWLNF